MEEREPYRLQPPLPPSPAAAVDVSAPPHQSDVFSQWPSPITIAASDLNSHIGSNFIAEITLLIWCKDRKGIPHEFLLLRVEKPGEKIFWVRIDRRVHRDASATQVISSTSPSNDTVSLLGRSFNLLPIINFGSNKIRYVYT